MLEKSFKYIGIEEMRIIPVNLLLKLEHIPVQYLEKLADNPDLVAQMPIQIKRQVWEHAPQVFKVHARVLCESYASDTLKWKLYADVFMKASDLVEIQNTMSLNSYSDVSRPKLRNRREGDSILKSLLEYIGHSKVLYQSAIELIRDLFNQTSNLLYAVLRMELLMSLHDEGKREVSFPVRSEI